LVAEIEFAGWTEGGNVRQAAFKGLRDDKPASEVHAEMPVAAAAIDSSPKLGNAPGRSVRGGRGGDGVGARQAGKNSVSIVTTGKNASDSGVSSSTGVRHSSPNVVMGVTISKSDKALWPDAGDGRPVTKLDLARYYEAVSAWLMPHIEGRPCSIIRAPDGLQGETFFQRHAMGGMSELFDLVRVSGDREPYVVINRREALAAVAQSGGVELHPWNCEPGHPEVPGRLVFDLDPSPDVDFKAVIAAALEMRARLAVIGLESFCKTTGGKGLHVVTPLAHPRQTKLEWPLVKAFAREVCRQMAAENPNRYLINMSKSARKGLIFLDYLRNDRLSTAVAPLSPRIRPGAPVSMPITWEEVRPSLDPSRFTLRTAPALIGRSKAWEGYEDAARPIVRAIELLAKGQQASATARATVSQKAGGGRTSTEPAGRPRPVRSGKRERVPAAKASVARSASGSRTKGTGGTRKPSPARSS
jgi:bifunctional non-homologous end joining protein LigD